MRLGMALVCLVCLAAAPARAQIDFTALADGELAHDHPAEALALYRRAHAEHATARTLRGMGEANYALRRYAEALSLLDRALAETAEPLDAEARAEVERLRTIADAFVGRFDVSVPAGARLLVDGERAEPPLVLDLGTHTLVLEAGGEAIATRSVLVEGGESTTLALGATDGGGSPEPVAARSEGPRLLPTAWAVGATGLSFSVLSLVAIAVHEDAVLAYNDSVRIGTCPSSLGCRDLRAVWELWDPVRYVFGIAGLAALGVSAVLVAIDLTADAAPPRFARVAPFGEGGLLLELDL